MSLPVLVDGGVVGPGVVPADILILEVAAVRGGVGYPEGGFVGLVVEEAVVPDYLAVIRIGVRYHFLILVSCVVSACLRAAVGFGETVVAVASCILCVAHTHCRGLRGWHFVVGEPGIEAFGCEALGAAVEGADCGVLVSRALYLCVCSVVVGRAWGQIAQRGAEGFSAGAYSAACQRTRTGPVFESGFCNCSYS